MSIPLLKYSPSSQNQRVEGYEVPNEDTPVIYKLTSATFATDVDEIIWAGYRQIFSEHLILSSYRQKFLESQLRNRAISVRDFIRGLGKSEVFRSQVAEVNSNYRLVDLTLQRFLGRKSYNKKEEIAWSIVIATKGVHGFIDALLDSDEYRENFGDDIVPYQRRRYKGRPFNLVNPRYSDYWRNAQSMRSIGTRSFYNIRTSGTLTSEDIRKAIPASFFAMAGNIITPERNYQRTIASVTSQVKTLEIPDTSREVSTEEVTIKPVPVSLPYSYIPAVAKN
ncbi:MAG: phycobilisome rod-core linker polypeptide CpcG1 [Nostocales cyanobacterium]|nr:MAG: phycobilisome rod-core linker polypeptide CpcG1 [Nostocales cyanobacterium]TAF07431.1 MAG: phycobilisome rod-core linker polypeptide CpcG1 [Nostocales cyanobacterium]